MLPGQLMAGHTFQVSGLLHTPVAIASGSTSPPSKGTASSSIHLIAAAFVCSGEFGNAAGLQLMAGQEGSAELCPQLRTNPALIPSAAEQVISQRCCGTNKQMVACSEQQGLEVKPGSSLPEVRRNDGRVGAKPWSDAVLGSLLQYATGPCGYLTGTRTSPQPLLTQPSC